MSYGTNLIKEALNVAFVTMTYGDEGVQLFKIGNGEDAKTVPIAAGKHLPEIIEELKAVLGQK